MVEGQVGYRFSPTGEESINYYLKNKNLGKTWLVKDSINEINICSFEPMCLPSLSKIKSDDLIWYFFSPIVYANVKKKTIKRTTTSGFWKATGENRILKDKRGSKIGIKKTLVYHEGKGTNGVRKPWVMHEYHITYLPPNLTTYVLCQVKYKGNHRDISYGGNDSVVSHSDIGREINTVPETIQVEQPVEDGSDLKDLSYPLNVHDDLCPLDAIDPNTFFNYDNPNLLQQTLEVQVEGPVLEGLSLDDLEMPENEQDDLPPPESFDPNTVPEVQVEQPDEGGLSLNDLRTPLNGEEDHVPLDAFYPDTFFDDNNLNLPQQTPYDAVIADQELIIQENLNVYRPRKALSGIIVDCSSDSDCGPESISEMSYKGTSSPHDSAGSSNEHFLCCSSTDSCKDLQTSGDLPVNRKSREQQRRRRTIPSKQEVKRNTSRDKETSMVKTKKKGWFILEEAMERNHKPRYIYLMNMITCFILLVGLIGNIKF